MNTSESFGTARAHATGRRRILCSLCAQSFVSKGTTRVLRSIVFQFCAGCWEGKRSGCEAFAGSVSELIPGSVLIEPVQKGGK
jgi:hypothetical protein